MHMHMYMHMHMHMHMPMHMRTCGMHAYTDTGAHAGQRHARAHAPWHAA